MTRTVALDHGLPDLIAAAAAGSAVAEKQLASAYSSSLSACSQGASAAARRRGLVISSACGGKGSDALAPALGRGQELVVGVDLLDETEALGLGGAEVPAADV